MKIAIFGSDTKEVEDIAKSLGLVIVNDSPDIVVSLGGDGTFMKSELEYPGIPKIALRNSKICKKCHNLPNAEVIKKISLGEYNISEEKKLCTRFNGKEIVGMNEIIVHNKDPRKAIRYEIFVNDLKIGGEIIGDGVVIATPFGSTGYYRSITDSFFEVGIGVAFNNSTEQSDHMVLRGDSRVTIKIIRGPAMVYADNHDSEIELNSGDEIVVEEFTDIARIIQIK